MRAAWAIAAIALGAASLAGCGGDAPAASAVGGTSTDMFSQCQAQAKLGDACACWRTFKPRFPAAPAGETAFSDAQLQTCDAAKAKREAGGGKVVFPQRKVDDRACYKGITQTGSASSILAELTEKCGAPTGMIKMTRVITGTQRASDHAEQYRVALRADECYRFFAIGDAGITNLVAQLRSPTDEILLGDNDRDRIKVLGPGAALCPKANGLFRVRISVNEGAGQYILQGWRRPASATLLGGNAPNKTASVSPPAGSSTLGALGVDLTRSNPDDMRDLVRE